MKKCIVNNVLLHLFSFETPILYKNCFNYNIKILQLTKLKCHRAMVMANV